MVWLLFLACAADAYAPGEVGRARLRPLGAQLAAQKLSSRTRSDVLSEKRLAEAEVLRLTAELREGAFETNMDDGFADEEKSGDGDEWTLPDFHGAYAQPSDWGYLMKSAGQYKALKTSTGSGPPPSAFVIGPQNFLREFKELYKTITGEYDAEEVSPAKLAISKFSLDNDAIWARENAREAVVTPLVLKLPYLVLCAALDGLFEKRPIARFWFLETVARMPYFSYISMLHLYESLGWWRRSAYAKKVHFAEEWNEFHHLLAMEALGGDERWADRLVAHHAAIAYYWVLVAMWIMSPNLAYTFSELIEGHAVDTYAQFVDENAAELEKIAAPKVIRDYYLYDASFDDFHTDGQSRSSGAKRARPQCDTLLDVFRNIRDDEAAHVYTMNECTDPDVKRDAPMNELKTAAVIALVAIPLAINLAPLAA